MNNLDLELIECVNYKKIGELKINTLLPMGTHLIIGNDEYIVVNYVLTDYDINTWKVIVKKATRNDITYMGKFF